MDLYLSLSQGELITTVLCVSLVGLTVTTYYRYQKLFTYWSKRGLSGPKPIPILGNYHQLLLGDRAVQDIEWRQKYGKVYGTYRGDEPYLVIAEPELIRRICIRDFDAFANHHLEEVFNKYQKSFIFFLQDDHWKRVRALMSPTFTSSKIKRMFRMLDGCADDLIECFNEQLQTRGKAKSAVVNVRDTYGLFAMDAITTCCYGLKLEREGSTNLKTAATRNDLVRISLKLLDFSILRIFIAATIPRFVHRLLGFELVTVKSVQPFIDRVERLMEHRKSSNKKFDDYLQLLLDARLEQKLELDDLDTEENHHAGLTHESMQADQKRMVQEVEATQRGSEGKLSDLDITAGAMFLLTVGLETTGAFLAHCSYALAFHQEIQVKLYSEIKSIAEYNENKSAISFEYAKLTSCQYLDSVVSETLRLLSPAPEIDRLTSRDYHVDEYNLDIPKGMVLMLSVRAVHMDTDYWKEPHKFDPERFMPGNRENIVPGSYLPFGLGPRHCLGMRFSLTESKLALAKTLMSFRFEPAPGLSFPPETKGTFPLFNIKTPLVTLVKRD